MMPTLRFERIALNLIMIYSMNIYYFIATVCVVLKNALLCRGALRAFENVGDDTGRKES